MLCRAAHVRNIDRVTIPENCLDVLAQSVVGMSLEKRWQVDEAFDAVRRSHCYHRLSRDSFLQVLRYLGSKDAFEGVYSKIWFDEEEGFFGKKKGARMIYFLNLGTIPEEANYKVYTEKGAMVGDLSEKFVERLATKDVFVLGGKSYEFIRAKGMKAFVRSASGRKPTVPSWTGEMLPRSFDLSVEVGRFRGEMGARLTAPVEENIHWLSKDFDIDAGSARSILSYFVEQSGTGMIPDDRNLLLEGYLDGNNNSNVIFHFPFGRRVNDALSRAYAFQVTARLGCNVSVSVVDDAFMLTIPRRVELEMFRDLLRSDQLDDVLRRAVKDSELFKQRFRHTASRSFMILRNYKGREVSINRQQVRSSFLLDFLEGVEGVPVIEETYREVLEDVMDIQNAKAVLADIESGQMALRTLDFSSTPSPFAHNVILAGISDIVLMEDRSTLLRQLHRKVLSKVLGAEARRFEFEEEAVSTYFRAKIGVVESKEDVVDMLRRTGPLHLFKEKGRSAYPYSRATREQLDQWSLELLEEGRISSVLIDDLQFVETSELPYYAAALRRERELGELETKALAYLDKERSGAEVEAHLGVESAKAARALRNLEAVYLVSRTSYVGGKWRYRATNIAKADQEKARDHVVTKFLNCYAPATVEEVSFALGLEEEEARRTLRALVEEEVADEGRFVISEHVQYMLKRDRLRLRTSGANVYDSRTVDSYRRSKQNGPFASIEECVRFFGQVGMPVDVHRRVPSFSLEEWTRLRRGGRLLLGRFARGRVRYVLAADGPMYAAVYRNMPLTFLDEQVLSTLRETGGMSLRQLVAHTGMGKEEARESLDRLDRNLYVIRRHEEGEDWSRENYYIPYDVKVRPKDPRRSILERFIRAYGPVPFYAAKIYTDFPLADIEILLEDMDVATVLVGDARTEMLIMREELEGLDVHHPQDEGVAVVSLYDPEVQPMWAEIASRFGEGWIFPILDNGRLIGATEKWEMSGCVELRSFDLDRPEKLGEALDGVDRLMNFYRAIGYDVVRIREVMDKPTDDLEEDVRATLEAHGYHRLQGMYAKGGFVPVQYSEAQLMSYLLRRQRLEPKERFEDILTGIKQTGGFRSDTHAWQRCRVHVPLKRLYDQGTLVRVFGIPDYVTYTSMEHARLYRKAKRMDRDQGTDTVLRLLEKEGPISRRQLYDRSPMGERSTYDALRKLFNATQVHSDKGGRLRLVPDMEISGPEARRRVVRMAFRNFGRFTAEELSRFLRSEMGMREIREALAALEADGFLAKGFLLKGSDALHWALREDIENIGNIDFTHQFVLSPDDTLMYYLAPIIRAKFGIKMPFHVIFDGPEMVAVARTSTRGKEIAIFEFIGPREARRIMNQHIRAMGMTLREDLREEKERDWEIQEFYERSYVPDSDDGA